MDMYDWPHTELNPDLFFLLLEITIDDGTTATTIETQLEFVFFTSVTSQSETNEYNFLCIHAGS